MKTQTDNKSSRSLKFKLIALSMGITMGLGVASVGVLHYILNSEEHSRMSGFESSARTLSSAIAAQFFERYHDVQGFARTQALVAGEHQASVEALNEFSELRGIYDLILVVDSKGKLLAVNSKGIEGTDIKSEPLYQKNFSETNWFKSVINGQTTDDKEGGFSGTYFEDVQIDPYVTSVLGKDHLGTGFSAALKNAKGAVIGVISARAGAKWFETAFHELYSNLKNDGYPSSVLSMVNKEGTLIFEYSSDPHATKMEETKYDWKVLLKYNPGKSGNSAAEQLVEGKSGAVVQVSARTKTEQLTGYTPVSNEKFISKIGWGLLVRDSREEAMATLNHAKNIFYIIFGIVIVLACLVAYWFSANLAKSLTGLAARLSHGSTEVASAASQISTASAELSDAATEQASAIQETAASIDEVSSMVKKSSENAAQSQKVSKSSRELAVQGKEQVHEMLEAIRDISTSNTAIMNQVEEGNRQIADIVKVIAEIGNKTKVINDIVFQTKLLSFNASVEAARAGEHGKGFAVVAEEVGNLAAMSGNAAKEISTMLESSIHKVEGIVQETKSKVEHLVIDGKLKVEMGKKTAEKCGEALTSILSAVQEVDGMVGEIASASHEQAQGVSEINKAINQLDQVTHQNTTVAQQAATSAEALSEQSAELKQMVGDLFCLINGDAKQIQSSGGEVVSLDRKRNEVKRSKDTTNKPRKLAAGAENASIVDSMPSQNDPRFEDV